MSTCLLGCDILRAQLQYYHAFLILLSISPVLHACTLSRNKDTGYQGHQDTLVGGRGWGFATASSLSKWAKDTHLSTPRGPASFLETFIWSTWMKDEGTS